jgi:hypothetical protein
MTLREELKDWADADVAAHKLAKCLGILPSGSTMRSAKRLFWSANPIGDMLFHTLEQLARVGILDRREEPDLQFRWCVDVADRDKARVDGAKRV